jgi:putative exosortase-associated protein (TIGR04073 family)
MSTFSGGDAMRLPAMIGTLLLLVSFSVSCLAQEESKPEFVAGKMSVKFVRGITNVATSVVELPKQTYLTVRDEGAVGYIIGPLKGIGMTVLRALGGAAETVFFLVPQPGYYDPVMNPDYVWNGWEKQEIRHGDTAENDPDVPEINKE